MPCLTMNFKFSQFMETTVLEGVLRQLPALQNNEFIKAVLMHEYFRNDQVLEDTKP